MPTRRPGARAIPVALLPLATVPIALLPILAPVALLGCDSGGGGSAAADGARPRTDASPADASRPGEDATPDAGRSTDGGAPDARPSTDAVVPVDPRAEVDTPLFDEQAGPIDAAAAALVSGWTTAPPRGGDAEAWGDAHRAAAVALRAEGAAAADRIVEICEGVPTARADRGLLCLRLLSLVESEASITWLAGRARLRRPPWPEGAHPHHTAPEDLVARVAAWSLGRRARAGSEPALAALRGLVADAALPDRGPVVEAVFRALPRYRAKALLREALPAGERHRLYGNR
jgi:hypothetical protein